MSIRQVPIRASVSVGGTTIRTPYVLSFNVHRRRGSPATFDVSVKVKGSISSMSSSGGGISISAGSNSEIKIFTGIIRGAKITPCWDDPSYVNVTLTGDDALSLIKGKKYTRRSRGVKSTFCIITDVVRAGLKSGKFAHSTDSSFELEPGNLNIDMAGSAHGVNSSLSGLKIGDAEGADLKNNLGVQIDISPYDGDVT